MARNKEFDYEEKLKVARDLFWKKGYNATSMSDLENATRINRSSLYQTYGNKHDLFVKSLTHYMEQKDKQYGEAALRSADPLEAVKNIINSVVEAALEETNCLFTNSIFELGITDMKIARLLRNQTKKAAASIEKLLQEAKDKGALNADKELKALSFFLVSGLTSIYYNQILFKDAELTRKSAELLMQAIDS